MDIILSKTSGDIFTDVFAGTGVLSAAFLNSFKKIIINDFLYSNNIIYKAFFMQSPFDMSKLISLSHSFYREDSSKLEDNYISKNFGNKYFAVLDAKKIGFIREKIDELLQEKYINEKEYYILLASLLYSMDEVANTVGHYDAYIKNTKNWKPFVYKLISPLIRNDVEIDIYRQDANSLIRDIETDILFLDPPYNSRQYSRFYHILENVAQWKKPELFGTAMKPECENMSDYCTVRAVEKLADLVENAKTKYIALTYNNTYNSKSSSSKNKITFDEIENIMLNNGKLEIFDKSHKFFNAGRTDFQDHKEYLFLLRKN